MSEPQKFVLRSTLTSPFGRKVRMALEVLGLADRVTVVPANPLDENDTLRQQNPLGKMPCLVCPDGSTVYDSRFRPGEAPSEKWLAHQRDKINRELAAFEAELPDPSKTNVVSIGLACALGYLDWRQQVDWRAAYPGLVSWLQRFSEHEPAFERTRAPTS